MVEIEADVVCISETWLTEGIGDCEIDGGRFTVYRRDRVSGYERDVRGGGVMVLVKNGIRVLRQFSLEGTCENVWVELVHKRYGKMCVGCFYVKPGLCKEEYNVLFNKVSHQVEEGGLNFVICGDFNVPMNFGDDQAVTKDVRGFKVIEEFLDLTGSKQHNDVVNHMGRTLDLVIASKSVECNIRKSLWSAVGEDTYHPALSMRIKCYNSVNNQVSVTAGESVLTTKEAEVKWNWKKADYMGIYEEVRGIDWDGILRDKGSEDCVESLYYVLYEIFDKHVEKEMRGIGKKRTMCRGPKWVSKETVKLIREKNKLLRKARKEGCVDTTNSYKESRKRVKRAIEIDRVQWKRELEEELVGDPRAFFSKFGKKEGREEVGLFEAEGGHQVRGAEAANLFVGIFNKGVAKAEYTNSVNGNGSNDVQVGREDIIELKFSVQQVIKAIKEVNNTRAVGTDNVPMIVIKGCSDSLAVPLTKIFNKAFSEGKYPSRWKECLIVPVFKEKGCKSKMGNYRPIAISNTFSKVFEHLLRKELVRETGEYMSIHQHGYLEGKSTSTNLMEVSCTVMEAFRGGFQVDMVLTDLSNAFDTVKHDIVEERMKAKGVSNGLIEIIGDFIRGRICIVTVGGERSEPFVRSEGVPQGSPLGGQLFILYIDDVGELFTDGTEFEIFADDGKIYRIIRNKEDQVELQCAVEKFRVWVEASGLRLNCSKCKVLSFSRKKEINIFNYKLKGVELERVSEGKDLGVIFDEEFTFETHRSLIIKKARKIAGMVVRGTREFSRWESCIRLFMVLVRPIVEYAVVVWQPHNRKDIRELERIQTWFLRVIYCRYFNVALRRESFNSIFYSSEGLRDFFKVPSLECRRKWGTLNFFWQIINCNGRGGGSQE